MFWPWGCLHCHAQPEIAEANLMDHWLEEMWPPSSTDCNSLDYFMWCVFEREVNKCPHITLTSLKVMTSAVVTDLDREVIIHACKKFQSWIEVVMEATGFLSNKCVYYMHINYSWNFHQNIFTLTISFIVLNAAIEFVLIYRPHPVLYLVFFCFVKN